MRQSRVRVDDKDTWYHCYNRIAGTSRDLPFGDAEREQFVRILRRVSALYTIRIVSYQVMSNHFHLLIRAPAEEPDAADVCRRYTKFHRGRRTLEPESDACRAWQSRCRDISWFMRHLQQLFTAWYNRTRPVRRRGSLWADRFKHTILEDSLAAWACWKYIENNPVRAGMVHHAGNYRFCSYGVWHQAGQHPFQSDLVEAMLPLTGALFGIETVEDLKRALARSLDENDCVSEGDGFSLSVQRKVRHWTQGLVIGSELFIREVMTCHGKHVTRRLAKVKSRSIELCVWRNLRPALE